ncbi:MAG TPA: 50S ribosomal protein L23 [bacterium]|nr:50S ribosomal protein L23 [bacterium]
MEARQVLRRPLLTEKATVSREARNEYAFEVNPRANKLQIKAAIEQEFSVKVADVRTVTVNGKMKRQGYTMGRRSDWKKALVTLKPGNTIELFEQT